MNGMTEISAKSSNAMFKGDRSGCEEEQDQGASHGLFVSVDGAVSEGHNVSPNTLWSGTRFFSS
jgi:hypothetical protein